MLRSLAQIGFGFALGAIAMLLTLPALAYPALADGQVVKRSDGFIYLIREGQRHWIQPIPLSDDDINAIPEAEEYTTGLAPIGSGAVVGERQITGTYEVTLVGSERPADLDKSETLDPGIERMLLNVAVHNRGMDAASYNLFDFEVQLADSTRRQPTIAARDDRLTSGDLLGGQTVAGIIAFDVPIGTAASFLIYNPPAYNLPPLMFPLS